MATAKHRGKRPLTRSFELREKIEDEIATGRIMPGAKLDEMELASRFRVSRTPIREALIQLASQDSSKCGRAGARSWLSWRLAGWWRCSS